MNLKIYSIKTNKIVNEISWPERLIEVYFSASGENLIIMDYDSLFIWNLPTKTKINEISNYELYRMTLSFDRKYILLSHEDTFLYNFERLELIRVFKSFSKAFCFSLCGRYLALNSFFTKIFDLWNDKKNIKIYSDGVLYFSPNSKYLLYKSSHGKLKSLKIPFEDNKNLFTECGVHAVSFSPDNKFFVVITSIKWIFVFLAENQE